MDTQTLLNTNINIIEASWVEAFECMLEVKHMTQANGWYTPQVSFVLGDSKEAQKKTLDASFAAASKAIDKITEAIECVVQTCNTVKMIDNPLELDSADFKAQTKLLARWLQSNPYSFLNSFKSVAALVIEYSKDNAKSPRSFGDALDIIFERLKMDYRGDEILKSFSDPTVENADDAMIAIEFVQYVKVYIKNANMDEMRVLLCVAIVWAFRNASEAFLKASQNVGMVFELDPKKRAHGMALFSMALRAMREVDEAIEFVTEHTKQ